MCLGGLFPRSACIGRRRRAPNAGKMEDSLENWSHDADQILRNERLDNEFQPRMARISDLKGWWAEFGIDVSL